MKKFTGIEYLAIDIANQYGKSDNPSTNLNDLDKLPFEERIQWVKKHQEILESLTEEAEEPHLYFKAVNAFRKTLQGLPIGHVVALDAVCSGLQIMSVLTGCRSGCELTGLIDPNTRTDAYSLICQAIGMNISRGDAKDAVMQTYYGSQSIAENLFGYQTPTYYAFYEAMQSKGPGAWSMLQCLLNLWNPNTLAHSWILPDGYKAFVPVMVKKETRVHIEELDYTMTIGYEENAPSNFGLSLPANVTHSVDAYVLRSVVRRCNYTPKQVKDTLDLIEIELLQRGLSFQDATNEFDEELQKYIDLWVETKMIDVVIINHLDRYNMHQPPTELLKRLSKVLTQVLTHEPFEVITVHDSFACHPNHSNQLRYWYKEVLAELADSTVLEFTLNQLSSQKIRVKKLNSNLADLIRESNYGIC